jgi:hypothetical protein
MGSSGRRGPDKRSNTVLVLSSVSNDTAQARAQANSSAAQVRKRHLSMSVKPCYRVTGLILRRTFDKLGIAHSRLWARLGSAQFIVKHMTEPCFHILYGSLHR